MKKDNADPHHLREKSDDELCKWIAGYNDDSGHGFRLLGMHELQRRLRQPDAVRSWFAIGISIASIAISIGAKLYS